MTYLRLDELVTRSKNNLRDIVCRKVLDHNGLPREQLLSLVSLIYWNTTAYKLIHQSSVPEVWAKFFGHNALTTTFILDLTAEWRFTTFASREDWAAYVEYAANSWSLCHDKLSAIEKSVLEEIPLEDESVKTINGNPWVLVVLLLTTIHPLEYVPLPLPKGK